MKKIISISIVCAFAAFVVGCQCGYHGCESKYRAMGQDYHKLFDLLQKKSDLADSIMSHNDVYDMDGSDNMADYLHISAQIDSIYKVNQ